MELLINEAELTTVRSLTDDRLGRFPDALAVGTTVPLSIGLVDRIGEPWTSRKFTPQSLADTTFRAALGATLLPPLAGKMTWATGNSVSDITDELSFDVSGDELDAQLNALPAIVTAGGVVVTKPNEDELTFRVAFSDVGAQDLFYVNVDNLVPNCMYDTSRLATGDVSTREVQLIRIVQNVGAIVTLSTAAASAALALTNPQDGGAGLNEQYRVALTGNIYKGSWGFTKGAATATILFDDTEAQIKARIEAMSTVGAGNVSVSQEDERTWLIEFIGSLANTAVTVTASGTNLTAIEEKTGTLDLRTPGIQMLLNGSNEKWVTLEIEKTVGTDAPVKILSRDVLLVKPVIEADMTTQPFAGTSQNGLASIGSGVDLIAVVFPHVFPSAPTQVMAIIEKPSGGDNIFATVRRDTISTTGFTAELSGVTPDANHKLSWVAIA